MPGSQAHARQVQARRRFWQGITRDLVLFTVGVMLIINESVLRKEPPRESLVVLFAGMVGLPAILRADWLRRRNGNGSDIDYGDDE